MFVCLLNFNICFLASPSLIFFSVRLLSVLRDHSVVSSAPQRPIISDFEGFSLPDLILILQKEPLFFFLMLSAKQGHYWYHFYNGFGMTRSLTGDWTQDFPHSKPALPLGYRGGGTILDDLLLFRSWLYLVV